MMKAKYTKLAIALVLVGALASQNVFADNPYGIEYTGGEPLGADNITIDPGLTEDLTPIISAYDYDGGKFFGGWEEGYVKVTGVCQKVPLVKIYKDTTMDSIGELKAKFSNEKYTLDFSVEDIFVEDIDTLLGDDEYYVFNIASFVISAQFGFPVFDDEGCTVPSAGYKLLRYANGKGAFVKTKMKLSYKDTGEDFMSDALYFRLDDIDASQSYKILNSDSALTSDNMYAVSVEELQPTNSDKRNMFVAAGHYIYSEPQFNIDENDRHSDVFVKVGNASQQNGLEVVFGYRNTAGTGINFYAREYVVAYESDAQGKITGITDESVVSGNTPSGSATTPDEGYELKYWTADIDVGLKDGTTIKAGEHILPGQVKQVVVGGNIVFTAHHELVSEDSTDPEKPDEPGDETKPDDSGKPDDSAKPDDKSEPKDEENSNVEVPDTGKNTGEFSSGGLELIGSVVTGIVVAAVLMGVYKTRQSKRRMWYN